MTIPHDGSKVSQWTTTPKEILNGCIKSNPNDKSFVHHPIIERFGSPEQLIYID